MSAAKKLDASLAQLISEEVGAGVKIVEARNGNSVNDANGRMEVVLCDGQLPAEVLALAIEKGYLQLIHPDSKGFDKELKASAKLALNPRVILDYPVSTVLSPSEAGPEAEKKLSLLNIDFSQAREKHNILERLDETVSELTQSVSLKADIITVADELLTNAIFNAPFVDMVNSESGAPRANPNVGMSDGKSGEFFCGADEDRIVIGCRDPYGRLNVRKLLEKVRKCYETSVAENMNMTSRGGAGIGSYMIFNSSTSYFVVVDEERITLVCSVLPIKGSSRARQEAPKNLHYVVIKEGDK